MRRKFFLLGLLGFIGCHLFIGSATLHAGSRPPKKAAAGRSNAAKPNRYQAYLILNANTGQVLEAENAFLKWPPASLTKLMLAYIVMQKIDRGELRLSDQIKVSRQAAAMGGSQVYLKEGEVFALADLMRATMIESANDAAYAIGEFVAGSKEEFIDLMNARARSLHMQNTVFHSLHGLPPSKGQLADVTTCLDLSILSRALLKYPAILEWTSLRRDRFRNGTFFMTSSNRLLSKMPEVDGLKTGYYRRAGHNIVATAKKEDLRLLGIVLGSPSARVRDAFVMQKFKEYFARQRR